MNALTLHSQLTSQKCKTCKYRVNIWLDFLSHRTSNISISAYLSKYKAFGIPP